jgi:hypothetical protein
MKMRLKQGQGAIMHAGACKAMNQSTLKHSKRHPSSQLQLLWTKQVMFLLCISHQGHHLLRLLPECNSQHLTTPSLPWLQPQPQQQQQQQNIARD